MTGILAKTSNNETSDRDGTFDVQSNGTLPRSILALVLRTDTGEMFMEFLRLRPPTVGPPGRSDPRRGLQALTLGKATVCLYVILLLAAMISATVLPRECDSQPQPRCHEITEHCAPETNT